MHVETGQQPFLNFKTGFGCKMHAICHGRRTLLTDRPSPVTSRGVTGAQHQTSALRHDVEAGKQTTLPSHVGTATLSLRRLFFRHPLLRPPCLCAPTAMSPLRTGLPILRPLYLNTTQVFSRPVSHVFRFFPAPETPSSREHIMSWVRVGLSDSWALV